MKVVLWGAGGHGEVVLDAVRQQKVYEPVAFIEDGEGSGKSCSRSGLPILHGRRYLAQLRLEGVTGMVIAIGEERVRASLAKIGTSEGFQLCTIVHPSAVICADARLGEGTVVFACSVVQTGSRIGSNVIINTSATVDHDCIIGDGTQLAPRVVLGGRVSIGDQTLIGIGATVINRISIGCHCIIGAGAVVVRNIPDDTVAYGVPARVVRERAPISQ